MSHGRSYAGITIEELLRLADHRDHLSEYERQLLAVELRRRRPEIAAMATAETIVRTAIAYAQKMEDAFWAQEPNPSGLKDCDFQDIVTEFVYLFLHLCDRDAFSAIPDALKRRAFLDSLFTHVLAFGSTLPMGQTHPIPTFTRREEKIKPGLIVVRTGMDELNDRQQQYGSLALFAAPKAPLAGSVFWEFGRHIAAIFDRYANRPSVQLDANLNACAAYEELIPEFAKMYEPKPKQMGLFRRIFHRRR